MRSISYYKHSGYRRPRPAPPAARRRPAARPPCGWAGPLVIVNYYIRITSARGGRVTSRAPARAASAYSVK